MAGKTIEAAGGIVVRKGARGLIAVVQRSKDDAWVLPRGKLKRDENPAAAARREVVEETGHRVEVHEFLGAITYRTGGRPKVVQFWRMEADVEPNFDLMSDISAVEWLPLKAAIRRLSYPLEKVFLRNTAARALRKRRASPESAKAEPQKNTKKGKPKKAAPKLKPDKKKKTKNKQPKKNKPKNKKPKDKKPKNKEPKNKGPKNKAGKRSRD